MDDQPPPYQSVAGEDDSGSDVDDDEFIAHSEGACGNYCCVDSVDGLSQENQKSKQKSKQKPIVRVTSAIVVCDVEGNSIPNCSKSSSDDSVGHLKQTNYNLVSRPSTERPDQVIHICHSDPVCTDIEVISSAESLENVAPKKERKSKPNQSNGIVKTKANGVNGINGHARVNYSRSPSRQAETANIEFVQGKNEL